MARILAFLLLSIVAALGHASTLLVLGDSLSAGYRMDAGQSWPSLLDDYWREQGLEMRVVNASISGETTDGGLARLPELLNKYHPDWVLIELGANDGLRGFPPMVTRRNLDRILALSADAGARPVLTQIRLPPNYGERYIRLFEAIYPDLADKHAVPLMPFFLKSIIGHPELMLEDGLHPKPEAQPLIRDQVAEFLAPMLHTKG